MIKAKIASAVLFAAVMLAAGAASAQTANTVNISSTPVTSSPAAGSSAVTLGTFTFTGTNGDTYAVTSVPLTLAAQNGGSVSDLSNCQLFNGSNVPLTTGTNVMNSLASGSNTFTFDQPLSVGSNGVTLTVECNVSSATPAGSAFQYTAGTPMFSVSSTASGSSNLGVMLTTVPSVNAGIQNAVLGLITLDGSNSNQNVTVSSIPVTLTFGGAMADDYSNCSLRGASNLTSALNTGVNAVGIPNNGSTSFTFDMPFSVPAGSAEILALTCSISSSAAPGSTIGVSINPAAITASSLSSGSVTPTTSINSSGTPVSTSGTVEINAANTTVTTPVVTTPGLPNTGAGGNSIENAFVLALAALAAVAGLGVLVKRQTR